MNILIVGKRQLSENICNLLTHGLTFEKAMIESTNIVSNACKKFLENPYWYDVIIVDMSMIKSKNHEWRERIADVLEMNDGVIIVCVFNGSIAYVSLYECMDLSRIIIMKYTENLNSAAGLIDLLKEKNGWINRSGKIKFGVRSGNVQKYISCSEIIYATKVRSGIKLVTVQGEYFYRNKMDDFEEQSRHCSSFCRCHSSFIVNFRYVIKVEGKNIFLSSGDIIPISRNFKNNVKPFIRDICFELES